MEKVTVRSAEQYFEEFGRNGIGKGKDKWEVKRQLINAFHKEIFELVALRGKQTFGHVPGMAFADEIQMANEFVERVRNMKYGLKMTETAMAGQLGLDISEFRRVLEESNNIAEQGRIVKNVIKDTTRKWVKLCEMFSRYVETKDLIKPDDLKMTEEDILKENHAEATVEDVKSTETPDIATSGYMQVIEDENT